MKRVWAIATAVVLMSSVGIAGKDERKEFRKSLEGRTVVLKKKLISVMLPNSNLYTGNVSMKPEGVVAISPGLGPHFRAWTFRGCPGDFVIDVDFERFMRKVAACRSTVGVGGPFNRTNVPTPQQPQTLEFEAGSRWRVKQVTADTGRFWGKFIIIRLQNDLNDETQLNIWWDDKQFSKAFTERPQVEQIIAEYLEVLPQEAAK